jgi:uncharacterized membrane protein
MIFTFAASIQWESAGWGWPAAILAVATALAVIWSYSRSPGPVGVRSAAALIKLTALALLVLCLLQPLLKTQRPKLGANLFLVVGDTSRSLMVIDPGTQKQRSEQLNSVLEDDSDWVVRLEQDFDVRRYTFDTQLESVAEFRELEFSGYGSSIATTLETIDSRYADRPVAGVIMVTDGNATDHGLPKHIDDLPPIYPVVIGSEDAGKDVSVARVTASEANFQVAPVSVLATVVPRGTNGEALVTQVVTMDGDVLAEKTLRDYKDGEPQYLRFRIKPPETGLSFFRVQSYLRLEMGDSKVVPSEEESDELTLENNHRLFLVDRGGGPYRVLYISGRPNWEFKFLRRATDEDEEVRLAGLVRISKKEAKFEFRGHVGETSNKIFRGSDEQDEEEVEQYDQAVILRLGVEDKEELRSGFPSDAEGLYPFHAVIMDDIEAKFFREDQMSLLQEFVSKRGGGLLMLGGQESFVLGGYRRTPIGELLPVYLEDRIGESSDDYRFELTRDGWLQPWVRLRDQEDDERTRLKQMPTFNVYNPVSGVKPGATVLALATTQAMGDKRPALVSQRFGKGRAAALMLGDMWRWGMQREDSESDDLENAWRQIVRWLVADVPKRVEIQMASAAGRSVDAKITVRNDRYEPEDNAKLDITLIAPDGSEVNMDAQPSEQPGQYTARFVPHENGAYRIRVAAEDTDGEPIATRDGGWVSQPAADEFRSLTPNKSLLNNLAEATGGEVVETELLEKFVASLSTRKVPVMENWKSPLWQQVPVFLLAIILLVGEWALRRTYGMA